jgi:two-component system chemotaxis response regulator CheB
MLPSLLNDVGRLLATHAKDGDAIRPGRILVAPPNRHMVVCDGHVELTFAPRENWSRPAIDPLFRTAAAAYGEAVVGVILTGQLSDGTAGLYEIKRLGGTTIVQDPADAEAAGMPQSAIANVRVDFRLPLGAISGRLAKLVEEARTRPARSPRRSGHDRA